MTAAVEKIKRHMGQKASDTVMDVRSFASGHNAKLYLLDLQDGQRFIAKVANGPDTDLITEAWMLKYLKTNSGLPVPDVILSKPDVLIVTYIPSAGVLNGKAQEHAAHLIAGLHDIVGESFGLERDTLIGSLPQPNKQEKDWLTFFRDHRLIYMAMAALNEDRINTDLMKDIEKLAAKLDGYIDNQAKPSLLHGDLWGGNILAAKGRITGFIDPAIYYGDPEIELAFSTLFNTFGDSFFRRYNELRPIKDGFFEVRKDIYNLYPLLVHVRIYGASYVQPVKRIVNRLVA